MTLQLAGLALMVVGLLILVGFLAHGNGKLRQQLAMSDYYLTTLCNDITTLQDENLTLLRDKIALLKERQG